MATNKKIEFKPYNLVPKTDAQEEFIRLIHTKSYIIASGAVGTGRSFVSIACAYNLLLKDNRFNKIIITRPAVQCGGDLGYLPGELGEKFTPFIAPFYDALGQMLSSKVQVDKFFADERIECIPINYLRGRSFKKSLVILDEAQNCTLNQLDAVITRIATGSRLIINGDIHQADIPNSGLEEKIKTFSTANKKHVGVVRFEACDIVRSKLITRLVDIKRVPPKKKSIVTAIEELSRNQVGPYSRT